MAALGQAITAAYQGRELDVVYLMNGATTFCADLVRHIGVPVRQHALGFSSYSYAGGPSSGEVRVTLDVTEPLLQRHVLMVEGIVVSGRTPKYVRCVPLGRSPGCWPSIWRWPSSALSLETR